MSVCFARDDYACVVLAWVSDKQSADLLLSMVACDVAIVRGFLDSTTSRHVINLHANTHLLLFEVNMLLLGSGLYKHAKPLR